MPIDPREISLDAFCDIVCENLPEDWRIELRMSRGEISLELYDPDGDEIDMPHKDDESVVEMAYRYVNNARVADRLSPIEIATEDGSRL